jgi:hypothetical protein
MQPRETRERERVWPLLTVETEGNGDSQSTNERGPSLVGSLGSLRDFCPALAALIGPVENIFFLTIHNFNSFLSNVQMGRQSCRVACLIICVSDAASAPPPPSRWKTKQEMVILSLRTERDRTREEGVGRGNKKRDGGF